MNYWLFQGNPDQFDVNGYLQKSDQIYWSVTVKKYQREISLGDIVFLWRAQGKKRTASGVVAKATVIEECKPKSDLNNPTWLYDELWNKGSSEKSDIKVGLRVESYRLQPVDNMITLGDFKADPVLRASRIVRVRVGSNFPLSEDEAQRIESLWGSTYDNIEDGYTGKEGKILYKIHRYREREKSLRPKYIEQYLKSHEVMQCELCELEPTTIYQDLGGNLLEVHHMIPLHKLGDEAETRLDDLMLVCPNCHSALHKGDAEDNLKTLQAIFAKRIKSWLV